MWNVLDKVFVAQGEKSTENTDTFCCLLTTGSKFLFIYIIFLFIYIILLFILLFLNISGIKTVNCSQVNCQHPTSSIQANRSLWEACLYFLDTCRNWSSLHTVEL